MTRLWPWKKRRAASVEGGETVPGAGCVSETGSAQLSPEREIPPAGSVTAAAYATAAGRDIIGSALEAGSSVTNIYLAPAATGVSWPLLVGTPPLLASSFQDRSVLRAAIDEGRRAAGGDVRGAQVLSGGGGVGKSQLAAAYAHDASRVGTDLVLWVTAVDVQQVIAMYAHMAQLMQVPGALGADVHADAQAFLGWLASTSRKWLVVLDDVTDPAALAPWWPALNSRNGWVLATSRLKDGQLTGQGRKRVDIDVYTLAEAVTYLEHRLTGDALTHLLDGSQEQLAHELGCLPLALGHAAAYLINQQMACADYLTLLRDRERSLDEMLPSWADTENYGRQVTAALLLSRAAAEAASPRRLALPMLRLTALLDPAGHPAALWKSQPVLSHLARDDQQGPSLPVSEAEVHECLLVLHRYALITYSSSSTGREVRMHALTARAVLETTPHALQPDLARTAADALLDIWPDEPDPGHELSAVLRANTLTLRHAPRGDQSHKVFVRAGRSMVSSGLFQSALTHWQELLALLEKEQGLEADETLTARTDLACTFNEIGQYNDARLLGEQVLADRIRLRGEDDPRTQTARAVLAATYCNLGRYDEALLLEQQVLYARRRLFGDEHPDTQWACANLAVTYNQLGQHNDALPLCQQVLAARAKYLGKNHPDTFLARSNLAATYRNLGRHEEALPLCEQVLTERISLCGPNHLDTHLARANLAGTYRYLGRHNDALLLEEQVLAARVRLLGDDHPDTHRARANLAATYNDLGRHNDALLLQEQVLAARVRLLGPGHPDTFRAQTNLAATHLRLSPSEAEE
ncbi:FxSxx-COOH system tetratricopeptide repeat protein [Streptomyces zaomyceticus]|uniref:FxSxx-COOH system tetratricopeptide repeat protein n=1 Tax=Streptomyces zaomyceticus TaxID=68286 RepID=A0ABZ1LR34_9ACTN|nr:FxSxx-COOH system tetratricopeptide repeat protein [Streptomyces zaomyceticus]